jgi:hypothetical protein
MRSFLLGLAAGAIALGLTGFMFYSQATNTTAAVQEELDGARAELAEVQLELAGIDLLAVYCRGVIDQYLNGFATPELQERNDPVCIDIMTTGAPPGFRGP